MAKPRPSVLKRQREQTKRDRQQRKIERREDRKRQEEAGAPVAQPDDAATPDG